MRAAIAECLVRTAGVVPLNPLSNGAPSFGEAAKVMQPDTLLFKTTKEALDETILLRRIRRNELLAQPVIAASGAKAPALKDESVIATNYRRWTLRAQRAEACEAGLFERQLGFSGATTQGELPDRDSR